MTASPTTSTDRESGFQFAIPLLVLAFFLSGCGPGRERGRLTGTVTYQGSPVSEGIVIFADDDTAFFQKYAIKSDGTFEVATKEGKGIWAGTYRVAVAPALESPPLGASHSPPAVTLPSNIPPRYWKPDTSGLKVEVKEGPNEPLSIELKP
jgi:hypothetical protein